MDQQLIQKFQTNLGQMKKTLVLMMEKVFLPGPDLSQPNLSQD